MKNLVPQTLIVGKWRRDAERQQGCKNQRNGLNSEPNRPTLTMQKRVGMKQT